MKQAYVISTGDRIIGTYDRILATAYIEGFDDQGRHVYSARSDVHWDTQIQTTRNGQPLFICESGHAWVTGDLEFR